MIKEEKAFDKWKQLADLDEIPDGVDLDEDRVWARIDMKLEKQRASKTATWILIIFAVITITFVAIAVAVRFNRIDPARHKPGEAKKINYVNVHQPKTIICQSDSEAG
ncbi:MAG: hypothetical protein ABIR18_05055 [Chitinophagaceae bacterium]